MRTAILAAAVAAGLSLAPQTASAEFPEQPITMIVGFSAGGGTDTLARLIASDLSEQWGQTVVVENQPGADGSIAAATVANAAPDGYTIAVISNAHTISPSTRDLPYEPVESFEPITLIASQPNLLLLHPSIEADSVQELIDLAKSKPGELTFGSSGAGTSPYLAMERLKQMADIDMVHVPYKGSAPAVLGIVSGEVDLMFGAVSTTLPHVEEGALKAIAVSTSERIPNAPDIPTVDESGLSGFQAASWYGVLAPAGTPDDVVAKLNEGIVSVLKSEEMSARLAEMGFDLVANSPDEFTEILRSDIATWGEVIANIEE